MLLKNVFHVIRGDLFPTTPVLPVAQFLFPDVSSWLMIGFLLIAGVSGGEGGKPTTRTPTTKPLITTVAPTTGSKLAWSVVFSRYILIICN